MRTHLAGAATSTIRSLLAAMIVSVILVGATAPVAAQESGLDSQGRALVEEFLSVLQESDPERGTSMGAFLADEFQIVRANGTTFDKSEYIASPPTVVEVEISDVHATGSEDILVVSYVLAFEGALDGVEQTTLAPRLSVFRQGDDGAWRISAHANFGALTGAN